MPATFLATEVGPVEPNIHQLFAGGRFVLEANDPPRLVEDYLVEIWNRFGGKTLKQLEALVDRDGAWRPVFRKGALLEIPAELLYRAYDGPGRYMIFARSTGRLYFTPKLGGKLFRYDRAVGAAPVELDAEIGLRAATTETPQGYVYTVSNRGDAAIYRFNTRTEKVDRLGPAAVGRMDYITTIDADETGRYLYYVPGAHGGSHLDGSAVVQYDVRTRTKKVIAFLYPFLKDKYGYTPIGTFSTAVSAKGDKLYITWHGSLAADWARRPSWDACALTVIHVPVSERKP